VNPQNKVKDGVHPRLKFALPLDGGGRRASTATVHVTPLDDGEQARFDVEVDNLLLELIRRQAEKVSPTCPTNMNA
jgi:hypothetical protein